MSSTSPLQHQHSSEDPAETQEEEREEFCMSDQQENAVRLFKMVILDKSVLISKCSPVHDTKAIHRLVIVT